MCIKDESARGVTHYSIAPVNLFFSFLFFSSLTQLLLQTLFQQFCFLELAQDVMVTFVPLLINLIIIFYIGKINNNNNAE